MADGQVVQWNDSERTLTERWSRVMGYMRPVSDYNIGKKQEFKDRKSFTEEIAMKTLVA